MVSGWCWLHRISLGTFFPLQFFAIVWERKLITLLKCLVEFTCEAIWSWTFVHWVFFLIATSISLLLIGLFRFSISSWFSLGNVMFLEIYPFLLGFSICWRIIVHNNLLCFFLFCGVIFNFSSFISYLFGPSVFFSWWVWLKAYQFCLSFPRSSS